MPTELLTAKQNSSEILHFLLCCRIGFHFVYHYKKAVLNQDSFFIPFLLYNYLCGSDLIASFYF